MVAEATSCFVILFSLLLYVFGIVHNKNERFLSPQSYQLRSETKYLILGLALCLNWIIFLKGKNGSQETSFHKAHWVLLFLSFHCFVTRWKQLALVSRCGYRLCLGEMHSSFRLRYCHLSIIPPSCLGCGWNPAGRVL